MVRTAIPIILPYRTDRRFTQQPKLFEESLKFAVCAPVSLSVHLGV